MTFNQFNANCYIFTFKEGLLSLLAHDLKLKCSKFTITIEDAAKDGSLWRRVNATFDAAGIKTVCAIKNGTEDLKILTKQDCIDIEKNIACKVLHPLKFPSIRFTSESISGSPDNFLIIGRLSIGNVTRKIDFPVKRVKDKYLVKVTLNQPDFGIKPFSALMNTMKIKPKINIAIEMIENIKPFQ